MNTATVTAGTLSSERKSGVLHDFNFIVLIKKYAVVCVSWGDGCTMDFSPGHFLEKRPYYKLCMCADMPLSEGLLLSWNMLWVSSLTCPSHLCLVLCCSLQVKLMKYICKQLQCKQKVPETERPEALDSYPHLRDWLRTINLRPELIEVGSLWPAWPVFVSHQCGFGMCILSPHSHGHEGYLTC